MNAKRLWSAALSAALTLGAGPAAAALGVELWTDKGSDAVYEPGDLLEVNVRSTDDSYLIVYEIDAEGAVNLLYPYRGSTGLVEGKRTYVLPPENSQVDLVVQESVGQCFLVAIASNDPFLDLPWYLRPYDAQADEMGYEGQPNEEEGITSDGKVVGDPYVAMERIRRRVLAHPDDAASFGTAYTTYYVHQQVKYPRYLCYDCHRPDYWAWWDGFDPYYSTCSVFTFRVNWGWSWGPGYWFGAVPYYYYAFRPDCGPRWVPTWYAGGCLSSWDGWRRWCSAWGGPLVRHKSPVPTGYVPPNRYAGSGSGTPPGMLSSNHLGSRGAFRSSMPIGRARPAASDGGSGSGGRGGVRGVSRMAPLERPSRYVPRDREQGDGRVMRPLPTQSPRDDSSRPWIYRTGRPQTPQRQPREEGPRVIRPREASPPNESPRGDSHSAPQRPQWSGASGHARPEPSSGGGVPQSSGGGMRSGSTGGGTRSGGAGFSGRSR
jgi:hypothetical protein